MSTCLKLLHYDILYYVKFHFESLIEKGNSNKTRYFKAVYDLTPFMNAL